MSTQKRSPNKANQAAMQYLRTAYPHIPIRLLSKLDAVMRFHSASDIANSIERMYELSLFRAGAREGLDAEDCNAMVEAHALMKAFRETALQPVDPLRGA